MRHRTFDMNLHKMRRSPIQPVELREKDEKLTFDCDAPLPFSLIPPTE
jgi:hypothetical protein